MMPLVLASDLVVTVEVPKLQLTVPSSCVDLKEYIWQHYQQEIQKNLRVSKDEEIKKEEEEEEEEEVSNGMQQPDTSAEHRLQAANQRLAHANRLLRRASAAQLQHFACMSHEIRTPLNCIVGLSSLLLHQKPQKQWTAHHTESVQMIATSGDLLLTVVNDVLDYSKLESGNVEISYQKRNLQETLNSTVYSLETRASQQQEDPVTVKTLFDARLPEFVTIDSCRLQQILYNLLGNALKFSKPGGVIELAVSLVETTTASLTPTTTDEYPTFTIKNEQEQATTDWQDDLDASNKHESSPSIPTTPPTTPNNNYNIRFRVKDHGKGIAEADFARIFEPFRQASAETEVHYGGTGLGLPVTAKLVHAMQGSISLASNGQDWAEFTVDLPFYDAAVDEEEQPAASTIYLVDGNQGNAMQLMETLEGVVCKDQVRVEHFWSMQEMLRMISSNGPLDRDRTFVCMVDEDLYEPAAYDLLSNLTTSVLLTFGPSYSVRERNAHFRSPNKVLPTVLLRSLRELVATVSKETNSRRPTIARLLSLTSVNTIPYPELRVLIAEDNLVNQKVLARLLDRIGVQNITIVENGKEAVDACLSSEFDVCLMDMEMPVMDGMEACRLILRHPGIPIKPKIVFATAHASPSVKVECLEAGAHAFLGKPYTLRDIEDCVNGITQAVGLNPSQPILAYSCGGESGLVSVAKTEELSKKGTREMRSKNWLGEVQKAILNLPVKFMLSMDGVHAVHQ